MKEFEVGQTVYITSKKEDWELLDAINYDCHIIQGEIIEKTVGVLQAGHKSKYYWYEIMEPWGDCRYRRAPEFIFDTEAEARLALEKERQDRIRTKKHAYEVLKRQLQELGEQR